MRSRSERRFHWTLTPARRPGDKLRRRLLHIGYLIFAAMLAEGVHEATAIAKDSYVAGERQYWSDWWNKAVRNCPDIVHK